jgi:uncharacterized protein with PQ loop repeat
MAEVFGWLASVLTVIFAWPQAIRALRASSHDGISTFSVILMLTSGGLWTAYGLIEARPFIVAANVSVSLAAALTAMACRRNFGRYFPLAVLGPLLFAAAMSLAPPFYLGLAGVIAAGGMTLPQAVRAMASSKGLEAVSPMTYSLLAVNAACWIAYGIGIGDPLVVAPNCLSLPASCLILWRRLSAPATG